MTQENLIITKNLKTMKNLKKIVSVIVLIMFVMTVKAQNNDYSNVGTLHNELLNEVLKPLVEKYRKDNTIDVRKEVLLQIKNALSNSEKFKGMFTTKEIKKTIENIPDYIFENSNSYELLESVKKDTNMSSELYSLIKNDVSFVESNTDYNEIMEYLTSKEENIPELSSKEQNSYIAFLSTMKSSLFYWSKEGNNNYDYIMKSAKGGPCLEDEIIYSVPHLFPGDDIVIDDALGAIAGGLRGGGLIGALIWGSVSSLSTAIHDVQDNIDNLD